MKTHLTVILEFSSLNVGHALALADSDFEVFYPDAMISTFVISKMHVEVQMQL